MNIGFKKTDTIDSSITQTVLDKQIGIHYQAIPGMIIAPTGGAFFSLWVLWDAVDRSALLIGFTMIMAVACLRGLQYTLYQRGDTQQQSRPIWRRSAVLIALLSGCIWGSAAIFLYPAQNPEYQIYLIVLFALIPIAPVAALATYIPTFFAYYIPCASPFIIRLIMDGERGSLTTAGLLIMLMAATITFATKYYSNLFESIRLQFAVQKQKEHLEYANQAKSTFLASASHDLRQPLHAVSLFIEALKPHLMTTRSHDLHKQLSGSAETLNSLLDGLLDISKLDAGVVSINRKKFLAGPFIQKLCLEFTPQAKDNGLRISGATTSAVLHTDPLLFERVARNLLSNAIRYTQRGGILVGCRWHKNGYRFQVIDTGIGIADADQEKIFDEFIQLHNQQRDRTKGLGLGLAIVKRITNLLGHSLKLTSTPQGTIVSVQVPRGDTADVDTEIKASNSDSDTSLQNKVLLVIDDEQEILQAMSALASGWGCTVLTCNNHDEAKQLIQQQQHKIDLLIVDYRLGDSYNGLDAAQQIIDFLGYSLPVVVVTGDTASGPLQDTKTAGYQLLHKPIHPNKLRQLLVQLIK